MTVKTGLDDLAIAKRKESKVEGAFKVPRDKVASVVSSLDEEEKAASSGIDDGVSDVSNSAQNFKRRQYRGSGAGESSNSGMFYAQFVISAICFISTSYAVHSFHGIL